MSGVADRLRRRSEPNDVAIRYGGDRVRAALPRRHERDLGRAHRHSACSRPSRRPSRSARRGVGALGLRSAWPSPRSAAPVPTRCSRDADAAMYQAKAAGRGPLRRCSTGRCATRSRRRPPSAGCARRSTNGEFRLYYQPIVSLWTKRLGRRRGPAAVERTGPRHGRAPTSSCPRSRRPVSSCPIGNWVLDEVCRQSQALADRTSPTVRPLNIKVNVSARQLAQADFVRHLRECLATSRADPDRICLEITERRAARPTLETDVVDPARGQGARREPRPRRLRHRLLVARLTCGRSASTCSTSTSPSSTASAAPRRTPRSSST